MVRNLGYQRKCSGRHEDDQELFSGRPQPLSGRRGHLDTQVFLACGYINMCILWQEFSNLSPIYSLG